MPGTFPESDETVSDGEPLLSDQSEPVLDNGAINADVQRDFENPCVCDEMSDRDTEVLMRTRQNSSHGHKEYVVYTERWYILAIFSMFAFMQSNCWNTWGPIENTAMAVLGWKDGQIALLANWGCIMFILSAFLFSWLLHAKGLRAAVLLTAGLLVIGAGVRCLPVSVENMTWTMNIGHIFIGLAGPVMMAAVTTLSAVWFPSNERTTATAIASSTGYLGIAASFLVGPQIVGDVTRMNTTTMSPLTAEAFMEVGEDMSGSSGHYDPAELEERLKEIKVLMFVEFGWTALVFVAGVIYFPARPFTPPTASAMAEREDMKAGLIAIVKKVQFWVPALAYSVVTGVYSGWTTQIVSIFNNEVNQPTAGWIGFYTNLVGVAGGILFARCVDCMGGRMKIMLLLIIGAASGAFVWVVLLSNEYIPFNTVSLYASVILFGFFVNATVPIFFEITVEGAFPIGEETTTIMMTFFNNIFGLVFLFLPMIPSVSDDFGWLNWVMLASIFAAIPLMLLYKEHYNRMDFDITPDDEDNEEITVTA